MKRMKGKQSFLTRLGRDTRGTTLALIAAAMLPLAGMIGGAVDMSRLYLTKTRLQQACDAGALAGRRVMATGAWTTGNNNGSAEDRAKKLFAANFNTGAYGTGTLTKTFTENEGTVTGAATVTVPMTIMRIFGMTQRTLSVNCTAKMEIPNTDVMFVLDVTGSMKTDDKIGGLKSAVKCFYEALLKVGTTEICDGAEGKTDPTNTEYTGTAQIRLGFVPYGVNVNVGYLLPNKYMADSWSYQSREATVASVQAWSLGNESAVSGWGNWSATPSNLQSASSYTGWGNVSGSGSVTVNGTSYTKKPSDKETNCLARNTNNGGVAYADSGDLKSASVESTTNNPPAYPAAQQLIRYTQNDDHTATAYRYAWSSSSCRLQQSATKSYSLTRTGGQSTKPIVWKQYDNVIQSWTYKQVPFSQIAGLKAGGSSWNSSINLPIGQTKGDTVKISGSNTNTTLQIRTDASVPWGGCIEEAHTFQNIDGDPRDDWNPIPSDALDMQVNLIPSDTVAGSMWGPMLQNAVWGRYYPKTSNRYFDPLTTSDTLSRNVNYDCPNPARKLAEYNKVGDLETYINALSADATGTYHDIGMLWGGRLLSPTGIFASENAMTAKGGPIQRHLIFMTDGNAQTFENNMTAYGHPFYDRRQISVAPSTTQTDRLVESRLTALCTQIQNMHITLWVISYGGGMDTANETRLEKCATPGRYYSAKDGPALISRFKQIASEIAELRLIS